MFNELIYEHYFKAEKIHNCKINTKKKKKEISTRKTKFITYYLLLPKRKE